MFEVDVIHSLCTIPASDLNYKFTLRKAVGWQIEEAIARMKFYGGKNKSRISACERELKKRNGGN